MEIVSFEYIGHILAQTEDKLLYTSLNPFNALNDEASFKL